MHLTLHQLCSVLHLLVNRLFSFFSFLSTTSPSWSLQNQNYCSLDCSFRRWLPPTFSFLFFWDFFHNTLSIVISTSFLSPLVWNPVTWKDLPNSVTNFSGLSYAFQGLRAIDQNWLNGSTERPPKLKLPAQLFLTVCTFLTKYDPVYISVIILWILHPYHMRDFFFHHSSCCTLWLYLPIMYWVLS